MKNYFYGFNINVRSHFNNPSEKNILFANNYDHVKNMSGIQSVTDQQNFRLAALNPALQGSARDNANAARLESLNEITKNNPNVRLTPDAYKALASGEAVNVAVQLEAPERRNLTIGMAVALSQLAGGLAGASYSQKLGDFDVQRASGDADFVNKNGNDYKLNPFGGAEIQRGTIVVTPIIGEKVSGAPITAAALHQQQIEASAETAKIVTITNPLDATGAIKGEPILSVAAQQQKRDRNGKTIEANERDDARVAGYTQINNGEKNGGKKGIVTSIGDKVTIKNVSEKFATDALAIAALGGGLIDKNATLDNDPNKRKLNREERIKESEKQLNAALSETNPKVKAEKLIALFNNSEENVHEATGNKSDARIGAQHRLNYQEEANKSLQQLTEANQNINDVLNKKSGVTISDDAFDRYKEANLNSPIKNKEELDKQIKSGNITGINETLNHVRERTTHISDTLNKIGNGIYAKGN
ncbi:MAG: hypothetical protein H7263_09055, partial [Candidatus Sericytochromatia bacterium]|nr:hypothetical protein [Candidatus Sericytochromatia bacterium]